MLLSPLKIYLYGFFENQLMLKDIDLKNSRNGIEDSWDW